MRPQEARPVATVAARPAEDDVVQAYDEHWPQTDSVASSDVEEVALATERGGLLASMQSPATIPPQTTSATLEQASTFDSSAAQAATVATVRSVPQLALRCRD